MGRAHELGSRVLKVSRLGAVYLGKEVLQFMEGPVFRIIIPTPVAHAATDGGLNEGLKSLPALVHQQPGIQAKDIAGLLDRPLKTVEKQIKTLMNQHYIERLGSRKTGGYPIISH